MSFSKPFLVFAVFFVFSSLLFVTKDCALSGEDSSQLAIGRAEDVVAEAYRVVLEAEGAGANVSGLLRRLNVAGEFLGEARISYRLRDFDEATRSADLCYEVGEEVRAEALGLRDSALEEAAQRFRWTMIWSILGVAIIVGVCFSGWRIFELRYYRRISEMKPEVSSGET